MSTRPLPRIGDPAPDLDEAIAAARTLLASADRSAPDLDPERCRARLVAVTALVTQVAELELHALHLADAVRAGEEAGASSTATWLALQTRQTAKAAHAKARLARALTCEPLVAAAMARGEVLPDQARAILDGVVHLPGDRTAATRRMLEEAAWRSAAELRVEGRRTLRAVDDAAGTTTGDAAAVPLSDPAAAPAADGSAAELVLADEGSALARGSFVVPRSIGATLRESLQQLMGPAAQPDPTPEQLGAAFCAFVRRRAVGSSHPPPSPEPATTLPAAPARRPAPGRAPGRRRSWSARLRGPAARLMGVLGRHLLDPSVRPPWTGGHTAKQLLGTERVRG